MASENPDVRLTQQFSAEFKLLRASCRHHIRRSRQARTAASATSAAAAMAELNMRSAWASASNRMTCKSEEVSVMQTPSPGIARMSSSLLPWLSVRGSWSMVGPVRIPEVGLTLHGFRHFLSNLE